MPNDTGVFVIIQAGPAQALVRDVKTERLDEMQFGAGVGAQANDVARVGRDFRLIENDGKHAAAFKRSRGRIRARIQCFSARAMTATVTDAAPCSLRMRAHSLTVAPVVMTSSISNRRWPVKSARHSKAPRTLR